MRGYPESSARAYDAAQDGRTGSMLPTRKRLASVHSVPAIGSAIPVVAMAGVFCCFGSSLPHSAAGTAGHHEPKGHQRPKRAAPANALGRRSSGRQKPLTSYFARECHTVASQFMLLCPNTLHPSNFHEGTNCEHSRNLTTPPGTRPGGEAIPQRPGIRPHHREGVQDPR